MIGKMMMPTTRSGIQSPPSHLINKGNGAGAKFDLPGKSHALMGGCQNLLQISIMFTASIAAWFMIIRKHCRWIIDQRRCRSVYKLLLIPCYKMVNPSATATATAVHCWFLISWCCHREERSGLVLTNSSRCPLWKVKTILEPGNARYKYLLDTNSWNTCQCKSKMIPGKCTTNHLILYASWLAFGQRWWGILSIWILPGPEREKQTEMILSNHLLMLPVVLYWERLSCIPL